jgi:hypothetical protein
VHHRNTPVWNIKTIKFELFVLIPIKITSIHSASRMQTCLMLNPEAYKVDIRLQRVNSDENTSTSHYQSSRITFGTMSASVATVYFVQILTENYTAKRFDQNCVPVNFTLFGYMIAVRTVRNTGKSKY